MKVKEFKNNLIIILDGVNPDEEYGFSVYRQVAELAMAELKKTNHVHWSLLMLHLASESNKLIESLAQENWKLKRMLEGNDA